MVYCAGPMRSGGRYVGNFHEMIRVIEGLGHIALSELSSTIKWGELEGLTEGADGMMDVEGEPEASRMEGVRGPEAARMEEGVRGPGADGMGEQSVRGDAEGRELEGARGEVEERALEGARGQVAGRGPEMARRPPVAAPAGSPPHEPRDRPQGGSPQTSPDAYIYERDMHWLNLADAMVAEVSGPSLGVGYELSYALHIRRIPVLCLCHLEVRSLSAMVSGNTHPLLTLERYGDVAGMRTIVASFLERARASRR